MPVTLKYKDSKSIKKIMCMCDGWGENANINVNKPL